MGMIMTNTISTPAALVVRDAAHPLEGAASDNDKLLDLIGDARFVLIGETSHGTHEFYSMARGNYQTFDSRKRL